MKEQQIIETLRQQNPDFQKLEAEHRALDEKIKEMESKPFLTPEEEMEIKRLKKEKLAKKDKMAQMVVQYKKGNGGSN